MNIFGKIIPAFFLMGVLFLIGCSDKNKVEENNSSNNNISMKSQKSDDKDSAPNFSLQSIDGKTVSLNNYKGKVVILDFWATWCGPCRKGIPDLVALQSKYKDDLVVIGVSLDTSTKNDVMPFAKEFKINYPVVYGNENIANNYGGINAIPTSFVIDKDGKIAAKYVGLVEPDTYVKHIENLKSKS